MKKAAIAISRFASGARALLLLAFAASLLCVSLGGCSSDKADSTTPADSAKIVDTTSGPAFKPKYFPSKYNDKKATGDAHARIDVSSLSNGYVGAKATSKRNLKFQVEKDGVKYNYDLSNAGKPNVFPVNMGDGRYTFSIYQNTSGNRYALVYTTSANAKLDSELEPYLRPNIMCTFTDESDCARKALELTADAKNQGDALAAIYNYVVSNVDYDTAKAANLSGKRGYVPVPDVTLSSKKGICFDYSSLTAAMLRRVGIPCKIITGYVTDEDLYHAWNMVYIDGTWQTIEIQVSEKTWTRLDTTYAAGSSGMSPIDSSSYRDRYVY